MSIGMDSLSHCAQQVTAQWIGYFRVISQSFRIPARIDSDDCIQECCLELLDLINEQDPTDPNFADELKTRVFRRLTDLKRLELSPVRDVRQTENIDDEVKESLLDFSDPADVAIARDYESAIERRLESGAQRLVWHQLLTPDSQLVKAMHAYRVRRKKLLHDTPVSVYAAATGLSVRQVRYALEAIRRVARQVILTEGLVAPCSC